MKKFLSLVVVIVILAMPSAQAASLKGAQGQLLTVSATTAKNGSMVTVRGNRFDETVGIYLALCVVPKPGERPTPCGGGVNKGGTGESSYWISSNPPPYGKALAIEYLPGGRFSQEINVTRRVGKFDCTKVKCAITVRADHIREGDRSRDIFIPIKFK
jgi:opacity protein-like surface antigen